MCRAGCLTIPCQVSSSAGCSGAACSAGFQAHLARAAEAYAPGKWTRMPSGAAHDAQILAEVMPVGMLFVPSIKGVSHNFNENTTDEDIALGCQVFADAVVSVLQEAQGTASLCCPTRCIIRYSNKLLVLWTPLSL